MRYQTSVPPKFRIGPKFPRLSAGCSSSEPGASRSFSAGGIAVKNPDGPVQLEIDPWQQDSASLPSVAKLHSCTPCSAIRCAGDVAHHRLCSQADRACCSDGNRELQADVYSRARNGASERSAGGMLRPAWALANVCRPRPPIPSIAARRPLTMAWWTDSAISQMTASTRGC
jgi:hypothetical protein